MRDTSRRLLPILSEGRLRLRRAAGARATSPGGPEGAGADQIDDRPLRRPSQGHHATDERSCPCAGARGRISAGRRAASGSGSAPGTRRTRTHPRERAGRRCDRRSGRCDRSPTVGSARAVVAHRCPHPAGPQAACEGRPFSGGRCCHAPFRPADRSHGGASADARSCRVSSGPAHRGAGRGPSRSSDACVMAPDPAPTAVPGAHLAPGMTAATAQAIATPVPTEEVRRRRILARGPELTLTRILIILLAALLGFSWIATMTRSNASSSPTSSPQSGVDASPITGVAPGASGAASPSVAGDGAFKPYGETQHATVNSIVDGDTIKVDIDGIEHTVRYIGMDAPETDATDPQIKRLADAATAANAGLVEGKDVYLEREVSDKDQAGRLLRDVWLTDGNGSYVLVNVEMVRLGFAQISTFPPDVRYVNELTAAQKKAQVDKAGIWSLGKSIPLATPAAPGAAASPQGAAASSGTCHPSYDPCLPIVQSLDCAQVRAMGKAPVTVKGPDEYMLDPEEDGLGCESNE